VIVQGAIGHAKDLESSFRVAHAKFSQHTFVLIDTLVQ